MSGHTLWGIDLGGTKIEGVVLQPKANCSRAEIMGKKPAATIYSDGFKTYDGLVGQLSCPNEFTLQKTYCMNTQGFKRLLAHNTQPN